MQLAECPSRMRWDLTSTSDWMPLFGRSVHNSNLPSVQPAQLVFSSPDARAAKQLKDKLERSLREYLMQLRKRRPTKIDFFCSTVLRKLLPSLEESRGGLANRNITSDHLSELSRICKSHRVIVTVIK